MLYCCVYVLYQMITFHCSTSFRSRAHGLWVQHTGVVYIVHVQTFENPVKPPWRWLGGWLQPRLYSVPSNVNFPLEMRPATLPTELPR